MTKNRDKQEVLQRETVDAIERFRKSVDFEDDERSSVTIINAPPKRSDPRSLIPKGPRGIIAGIVVVSASLAAIVRGLIELFK